MGGERGSAFGAALPAHVAECAAEPPLVVPILESHAAFANVAALAAVPGVGCYWFGPCDHSATNGHPGEWEGGETAAEVLAMVAAIRAAGRHCGVVCTSPADLDFREREGVQLLCAGSDTGLLMRGLRAVLGPRSADLAEMNPALDPAPAPPAKRARAADGPAAATFRVGVSPDFYGQDGAARYDDFGLRAFGGTPAVASTMAAGDGAELTPAQVSGSHGILVLAKRVTAATVAGSAAASLVAVSRFGVGYDSVDVEACTANDVAVLIAAGAVDHSMAEATVGFMLQLTHRSLAKHLLVADGGWDERSNLMGAELRDRVFGAIGLGGIARATVRMLAGFRMAPPIAYDPYADPKAARALGVRLVSLDECLAEADFVSVHCPLNAATRGLLGAAELSKMKRGSYLINTARGGIVSEDALLAELNAGRIAGAATDCFETEPVAGKHPCLRTRTLWQRRTASGGRPSCSETSAPRRAARSSTWQPAAARRAASSTPRCSKRRVSGGSGQRCAPASCRLELGRSSSSFTCRGRRSALRRPVDGESMKAPK